MSKPTEYIKVALRFSLWDRIRILFGCDFCLVSQNYVRCDGVLVSNIGLLRDGTETDWLNNTSSEKTWTVTRKLHREDEGA